MGGAGVTVTATTVERRRVLGETNTARRREKRKAERGRERRGRRKISTSGTERRRG